MKKLSILSILAAGFIVFSCQKKAPDYANSIPDDAFAVVSIHPMQIHSKGQLKTLENLKSKIKEDFIRQLIDDPESSGLILDKHAFIFATIHEESPEIGVVAGMGDEEKFKKLLNTIDDELQDKIIEKEGFKMVSPEKEGAIGWNRDRMIMLLSPEEGKDQASWAELLDSLFNLPRESSITSMVDFKDFTRRINCF